jgi:hypothetical protein
MLVMVGYISLMVENTQIYPTTYPLFDQNFLISLDALQAALISPQKLFHSDVLV